MCPPARAAYYTHAMSPDQAACRLRFDDISMACQGDSEQEQRPGPIAPPPSRGRVRRESGNKGGRRGDGRDAAKRYRRCRRN